MRVAVSAMLLTFLTAISAGALLYAYVTGIVGDVIANIPNVSSGQLVLNSVSVNDVSITANVKNIGSKEVLIVNYVYVNEVPSVLTPSVQVLPGSTAIIRITGTYTSGNTYNVKLVCTNGYTVTFDVTY
ncbi:MAG: hypothetical protein JSV12_06715 [Candidatus Bathyarchaeota archaeon]|nr:MAG: hypothetical protein JSV12_06715 [Candidatus Bathyarchaeota archaeon]